MDKELELMMDKYIMAITAHGDDTEIYVTDYDLDHNAGGGLNYTEDISEAIPVPFSEAVRIIKRVGGTIYDTDFTPLIKYEKVYDENGKQTKERTITIVEKA